MVLTWFSGARKRLLAEARVGPGRQDRTAVIASARANLSESAGMPPARDAPAAAVLARACVVSELPSWVLYVPRVIAASCNRTNRGPVGGQAIRREE